MSEFVESKDLARINSMTQADMARLQRFAPAGHRFFVSGSVLLEAFNVRFAALGGMTPGISKNIGWGD